MSTSTITQKEEDPRLVLPLLYGLSKRPSAPPNILEEALNEFDASCTISRWLISKKNKIIPSRRDSHHHHHSDCSTIVGVNRPCHRLHWLFRSLLSTSIRVRKCACKIILDGLLFHDDTTGKEETTTATTLLLNDNKRKERYLRLRRVIFYLIEESSSSSSGTTTNRQQHNENVEGGDPIVQLFGLISFLLFDFDFQMSNKNTIQQQQHDVVDLTGSDETMEPTTTATSTSESASVLSSLSSKKKKKRKYWLTSKTNTGGASSVSSTTKNKNTASTTTNAHSQAVSSTSSKKETNSGSANTTITTKEEEEKPSSSTLNNNNTSTTSSNNNKINSFFLIESFVQKGGLRWIARNTLNLVLWGKKQQQKEKELEQQYLNPLVQLRLTLWIEFVYHLYTHHFTHHSSSSSLSTSSSSKEGISSNTSGAALVHSHFWSVSTAAHAVHHSSDTTTNTTTVAMTSGAQQQAHGVKHQQKQKEIMSPLASFLCIHEILKEQVISLVGSSSSSKNTTTSTSLLSSSSNTKSSSSSSNTIHHPSLSSTKYYPLEKSFQMLSQLMDPTFLLNATSVSAATTTNTSVTAKSNTSSSLSHHHVNKKRKTSATSTSSTTTTRKRSMSQILRNALRQGQEDVEMLAGVGTKDDNDNDDDDDILPPSPPHGFFTSFFSSSSSSRNNNNDSNTEGDATGANGDTAVTITSNNNNEEEEEDEDMADIPDDDDDNEGEGAKQEQVVQADSSNNNDDVIISLDNTEVLSVDGDDDEDDLSEINHEEEDEIEVMDEDAQDVDDDDDDDDDIDIDIEVDDEDEDHHNDPEDMPDMYYQMFQYLDTNKQRTSSARSRSSLSRVAGSPNTISKKSSNNNNDKATALNERKQAYLLAGMQILESQYPPHAHHNTALNNNNNNSSNGATTPSSSSPYSPQILLSPQSEQSLLQSMCNIIRPPPKPIHLKVFLRRAPTQEEFFRGSLTKNPIPLSLLKGVDPTFSDLRSHIANDLQMADSAELLELLVVGKIIPIHFKVRVVQETLWRKHVLENTSSSGSSSSRNREDGYTSDIETSLLPPMTVTYRLAGVDGEATEDIVEESDVIDPRQQQQQHEEGSSSDDNTKEAAMEKEFAITKTIMSPSEKNHNNITVLLRSIEIHIRNHLRKIRRDDVKYKLRKNNTQRKNKNSSRQEFAKSPVFPGLLLFRHCARLKENRKKMVQARAPTMLLRLLLDTMKALDGGEGDSSSQQRSRRSSFDLVEETNAGGGMLSSSGGAVGTSSSSAQQQNQEYEEGSCPTANLLQELIELFSSDISASSSNKNTNKQKQQQLEEEKEEEEEDDDDVDNTTIPLLLSSLDQDRSKLSPSFRHVIANLLPFLTYGKTSLSCALALEFIQHVNFDLLNDYEDQDNLVSASRIDDDDEKMEDTTASTQAAAAAVSLSIQSTPSLMLTFVDTSCNLPTEEVCNTLRLQLLSQGFIQKVVQFALRDAPYDPPPWTPALAVKSTTDDDEEKKKKKNNLDKEWKQYLLRPGLRKSFKMLIGLCSEHIPTQNFISNEERSSSSSSKEKNSVSFLKLLHWIENITESAANMDLDGIGLLAETLLDALKMDNPNVAQKVKELRDVTKKRKKEIADEKKIRALGLFSNVISTPASASATRGGGSAKSSANNTSEKMDNNSSSNRNIMNQFNPSLLFPDSSFSGLQNKNNNMNNNKAYSTPGAAKQATAPTIPSWMAEMELMEDETGYTCAVCQEGSEFKPTEMIGLYAYIKKVSIPANKGGAKPCIDGTQLLLSLPTTLPKELVGTQIEEQFFNPARVVALLLSASSSGSSSSSSLLSSSRPSHFITTVTACTAIHTSCHAKARRADRNHPKAPKSEWEGASLRNNRVTCNVILPVISSKSQKVPLVSVESSLQEYQTAISNVISSTSSSGGGKPKSMLWIILFDVRLLLLRISYGETLNADCGGGSLTSNVALVYHMFSLALTFAKHCENNQGSTNAIRHAKCLSAGFIAACEMCDVGSSNTNKSKSSKGTKIIQEESSQGNHSKLQKPIADAAPMAAICSILFPFCDVLGENNINNHQDGGKKTSSSSSSSQDDESMKKWWGTYNMHFFKALIQCAGRRKYSGIEDSGCTDGRSSSSSQQTSSSSSNKISGQKRPRSSSWDIIDTSTGSTSSDDAADLPDLTSSFSSSSKHTKKSLLSSTTTKSKIHLEEQLEAIRPFMIFFVILNTISKDFVPNIDDEIISSSAESLVLKIKECRDAKNLKDLLSLVNDTGINNGGGKDEEGRLLLSTEDILAEFDKGYKPF